MSARIITAARVLTGRGATHAPGAVVVDEGKIAWVGPASDRPGGWQGAGIERIDLPQATVMPGLIDAHVHLSFGGAAYPPAAIQATTRLDVAATIRTGLAELLRAGVTTVRDLGAPRYTDIDTLTRHHDRPRVRTATIPLTLAGGHCHGLGGAVDTLTEIRDLVAANAARGADWIKIMGSGGFTTGGASSPYEPQFTDTQLRAAVDAAHRHGLPVAAHAHGTAAIRQAVAAGVDSIEHCTWMTADGFDLDHGLVREIADRGILVCPTINHLARSAAGRLTWPVRRDHLRVMLDAGVRLIPGSDSGIPHTPPGRYPHSLPVYLDLGLSPAEVIDLATRQAADALRIGHLTGTLAAGLSADLIAIPGDPTRDLDLLITPILTMAAGHLHHPDAVPEAEEDTRA
ncbi:amidohydrolase family protein [Nocardia cyriacigeorgica]|uniref:metal-dependent hydrolase family protein n=1 Tax=Nocardia cyriacigeorgica TaxID=135487 RepID=UPI0018948747|nr:amidohydrolase family protein [Nocardia cyriacigeorgica]MBF6163110.1 amidohydrolase family protein [Nocardia cyriacigeorgica]MBF6202078.1 amidohydrolase family protein [Nocardia cyriacigeorgica]MBF6518603.1 amidohydrolase family protein [Nocardia cyriacigeorgica]